jgi:adenylosuccinate lyase
MQRDTISPLDGRYAGIELVRRVRDACSERCLMKQRFNIEVAYLRRLVKELNLVSSGSSDEVKRVNQMLWETSDSSTGDIDLAFEHEKKTHHDVKAVELALVDKLRQDGGEYANRLIPFVHFGLTSQDVNSAAIWLQLRLVMRVIEPELMAISKKLHDLFFEPFKDVPMLARTHGQPATPTTFGKEMLVFADRIRHAFEALRAVRWRTKFGGATGGFNAHQLAFPDHDWPTFGDRFLKEDFDLERLQHTTQIDHYDEMGRLFDAMKRCNTILIDLCRDVWDYISRG